MRKILFLLQVISVLQFSIYASDTTSSNYGGRPKRRQVYSKWTSEMQNALIEICKNTPSDEPYYYEQVRRRWRDLRPDFNVSDGTFYRKLYELPKEITGRAVQTEHKFKWDEKKEAELADIYLNTRPYNGSSSVQIKEEWENIHPDFPKYDKQYLASRARNYLKKHPSYSKGESSKRMFEWTIKQDSDVYHIHHVTLPEGRSQPIYMHKIWADLHPNYRDLSYQQLAERVKYLQKNPPDENFPWASGQKQELLKLYHSTDPGSANQGQRIYDIWTKIHPRYSFMTPYYLQVHASTLAHQEEIEANGRKYCRLTDEQRANLVYMYHRLRKPNKPLYDFHKEWVWEYPSLAHLTTHNLLNRIGGKNTPPNTSVSRGEEQPELCQFQRRKNHVYTREEEARLLDEFRSTYPQESRYGKRLRQKWIDDHKGANDVNGGVLEMLIRRWKRKECKSKRKAAMMIPKIEIESETASRALNT